MIISNNNLKHNITSYFYAIKSSLNLGLLYEARTLANQAIESNIVGMYVLI